MKTTFPLTLLALLSFAPATFAKEKECCWIDVKTGKTVATVPLSGKNINPDTKADPGLVRLGQDGKTAFNPRTGQNFAREPDGCWIDVKTGKRVATVPLSGKNINPDTEADPGLVRLSQDGKTAFNPRTGQNFARVPCPLPGETTGDTLKKVFDSVHIGIGIGGGYTSGRDEHHHGEDRHRTADKVSTDKTKTHTISPTTTHKTVTAGCKCHPCNCSPCSCH